jgi:hypothetical protein
VFVSISPVGVLMMIVWAFTSGVQRAISVMATDLAIDLVIEKQRMREPQIFRIEVRALQSALQSGPG